MMKFKFIRFVNEEIEIFQVCISKKKHCFKMAIRQFIKISSSLRKLKQTNIFPKQVQLNGFVENSIYLKTFNESYLKYSSKCR